MVSFDAGEDLLKRLGAKDDLAVLGEIESIEFVGLLEGDALDVADGARGVVGKTRIDEQNAAFGGDTLDDRGGDLGFGRGDGKLLDDGDLAGHRAIKESTRESQGLHLGIDFLGVVAGLGTEDDTATHPKGGTDRASASAAGALLAPRLLATAANFAAGFGGVRALAVVGVDCDDDFLDRLKAFIALENGETGKILLAGAGAVGTKNSEFHDNIPPCLSGLILALECGAHDHVVAVGTGDGSLDEEQVLLADNFDNEKVLHRALCAAHVAGHLLILPGATGRLAHADRTDAAMEHRTVGGGTAGDTEAFHNAGEAFTLGDPDNVDKLAGTEGGHGNDIAGLGIGRRSETNFVEDARGDFKARLGGVLEFGFGGVLRLFGRKTELDGVVAVGRDRLHLDDGAWTGFDHGHRNEYVGLVVDLGHSDLFTDNSTDHWAKW